MMPKENASQFKDEEENREKYAGNFFVEKRAGITG